jgi:integrase
MATDKQRQKLSKRIVDALEPRQTIWDTELTGFGVRRQQRDPSFVLKYSFQGRQRFYTLGRHGVVTVDQARTEARRLLGLVAGGTDPCAVRDEKAIAPQTLTVGDLCTIYVKEGPAYKPNKQESSWYTDRSNIHRHIRPLIGDLQAEKLSEADVVNFLAGVIAGKTRLDEKTGAVRGRAIVRGGKGAAARALAVLGAIYAFAIRRKLVAHNPTAGVKAPKGSSPGRFLTDCEWQRLGAAMEFFRGDGGSLFIDAVNLLALTGCRKSEILRLRWNEVDLRNGLLRIEHSKAGPRVVPLGDHAILFLENLQKNSDDSLWVFPSRRGAGPIVGIQKIWDRVCDRADLPRVRLHDLRHSFASQAVNSGASLYLTGAILGHRQASTTQRYAHLQSTPVRLVATGVTSLVAAALNGHRKI